MQPSASSSIAKTPVSDTKEAAIRHLPPAILAAFRQFEAGGEVATLDPVILAILDDYIPRPPAQPLADLPGGTRLIEDLGFDSLAITEVVFFTEDLLDIRIANEEIIRVRTMDDLRSFVRSKVSTRAAG